MAKRDDELVYGGGAMWFLSLGTFLLGVHWMATVFFLVIGTLMIAAGFEPELRTLP